MPFSHQTGTYNVQSSLVAWLQAQINASPPPATGPLPLVLDSPDQPVHLPEISVHFLSLDSDPAPILGQQVGGGQTGARRSGQMEIDCWVSRQNVNWRAQTLQMQDVITKAVLTLRAAGSSLPIYDFYGNAAAPAVLAARVFIGEVTTRRVPFDPNPAIERQRVTVAYWWVERN